MKYLLSLVACVAVLFAAIESQAQQNNAETLFGSTSTVAAGASNTTSVATMTKSATLGLYYSFKLTGAGTDGVLFRVDGSIDNSTWQTGVQSWFRAGNGTTAVTGLTNLSIGAWPFIRIQIHNTNNVVATNWTIKAFAKQGL
jgi:hypothetical protein